MTSSIQETLPVALADMPTAEWAAAIVSRRSTRSFEPVPLAKPVLDHLQGFCASLAGQDTARLVVVPELPPGVFTGVVGSYGKIRGARSALLVVGRESRPSFQESAGYLGEAAILEATAHESATCWIGGFFDQKVAQRAVSLDAEERVLAVVPLGQATKQPRTGERVFKRILGAHKRRPLEETAPGFDEDSWPAWAAEGVRLARVAPSAVNRQPWQFRLEPEATILPSNGVASGALIVSVVERELEGGISRRLDCGIAMLHFEVGARLMGAIGRWEILEKPDVARYRVAVTSESGRD